MPRYVALALVLETDKDTTLVLEAAIKHLTRAGAKIIESQSRCAEIPYTIDAEVQTVEETEEPTKVGDDYVMTFGKFKGERIGDVPAWYLDHFADTEYAHKYPEVLQYIADNRSHIDAELDQDQRGEYT